MAIGVAPMDTLVDFVVGETAEVLTENHSVLIEVIVEYIHSNTLLLLRSRWSRRRTQSRSRWPWLVYYALLLPLRLGGPGMRPGRKVIVIPHERFPGSTSLTVRF